LQKKRKLKEENNKGTPNCQVKYNNPTKGLLFIPNKFLAVFLAAGTPLCHPTGIVGIYYNIV
jgi:hypothetical protein